MRLRTRGYEWVNWQLQSLSLRSGWNLSRPSFICCKLTMRCNARCLHCNIHLPENTPPDELTAVEWKQVLRDLRRWLGAGAPLTMTGGEILLRKDVFTILEEASALGFSQSLLTNGWLLTEANAERLMGLRPRVIQVSLDGARAETHDLLRGRAGFGTRVEAGIYRLAKARRRGSSTRIVASAVVFRQNMAELEHLVRKVTALGADEIKFQPIEQTYMESEDPSWHTRSPLWIQDAARSDRALDQIIRLKHRGWPIQNTVEHLEFMKRYFRHPRDTYEKVRSHDQQFRSPDCRAAVSDFDIASNGDVRLCYRMEPIGNVRRQNPKRIWDERPRCWTAPCPYRATSPA